MKVEDIQSMKNKIILLITLYFPPEIGGGSTGAWNRALVFNKLGYKVLILTGFPSYPTGKIKDKKYSKKIFVIENLGPFIIMRIRLPPLSHNGLIRPMLIFSSFVFLSILFSPLIYKIAYRPTIVYSRSPIIFSSLIGLIYSRLFHCKYFYEVPDLWPEELFFREDHLSTMLFILGKFIAKVTYFFPDKILTTTKYSADYLIENYHPKSSVHGIPVGVDVKDFKAISKNEARLQLINLSLYDKEFLNKFIVLYTGRLSVAQGVSRFVDIATKLKKDQDIILLIIGEGPERKKLESAKLEKKLDNLVILSAQKRALMPSIISSCDVCTIILSPEPIFRVVFPTKFFEYLACSKPILGICQGELSELIKENSIGVVSERGEGCELANSIKEMKNSPNEMLNYEQNSARLLKKYSIEEISLQFKKILIV
jgi:glycosyltransferase involved in cell wall biosynthesis